MRTMVNVSRVVAGILLTVLSIATLATVVGPKLFGWETYVVTSGSMEPTFSPGAIVMVQPMHGIAAEEHDVITFHDRSGGVTTHRVDAVFGSGANTEIYTKGDANEDTDPGSVPADAVIGKARYGVPLIGHLTNFIITPFGAGVAAAVFLWALFAPGPRKGTDDQEDAPKHREPAGANV